MILGGFGIAAPARGIGAMEAACKEDTSAPWLARSPWHVAGLDVSDLFARDGASGSWLALVGNPLASGLIDRDGWTGRRAAHLLDAFATDGTRALRVVDGAFAIAWWDARRRVLTLVRDRFGAEPLFWARLGDGVVFGSNAAAVADLAGSRPRLSAQGLAEFLTWCYLPGTATLYDGVERLEPSGCLQISDDGRAVHSRRWYRLSFAHPWPPDEAVIARNYRELLDRSVQRRLDGLRAGVLLSGGMDSSSVATFARRHREAPIGSFSFRCGGRTFDESHYARVLASELRLEHCEVDYGEGEALEILAALPHMDVPFCDIGIEIGTWLLAGAARGRVDYVLTGDGGDELWASHPVYAAQKLMRWYDRAPLPQGARVALARTLDLVRDSDSKRNLSVVMKRIVPPPTVPEALGHFRWRVYQTPESLARLCVTEHGSFVEQTDPFRPVLESLEGYDGPDDGVSPWLHSDYRTASGFYFSRLQLARHFGIEARTPFYDRALVEYGARIPAKLKLEGIERTKRLFRVAMEGVLADEINHRRDKLGHSVPLKNWLRGNGRLHALVDATLASERFLDRGLFRPDEVRRLVAEHAQRKQNHSHRLWALFVLEHWLRVHIDRDPRHDLRELESAA